MPDVEAQRFAASHPLRVRGLKLYQIWFIMIGAASHPLRVRGLKLKRRRMIRTWNCRILYGCVDWNKPTLQSIRCTKSHPLRVRGLKHYKSIDKHEKAKVASFTGAWIETPISDGYEVRPWVASFTGAWIETSPSLSPYQTDKSHPLRVRGLKLLEILHHPPLWVASFTGAWIETMMNLSFSNLTMSRILYGCVDWNHHGIHDNYECDVASFTGAWIETCHHRKVYRQSNVASFTGAWIET